MGMTGDQWFTLCKGAIFAFVIASIVFACASTYWWGPGDAIEAEDDPGEDGAQ